VKGRLLNLAFFIFYVLARYGIVLSHHHFFGHCARVLFGHIKMSGSRARIQADFDCGWLRHVKLLRRAQTA